MKVRRAKLSELFDRGSKASGRSKCTAGGDEESTKRSGEMESHATHKHNVDMQCGYNCLCGQKLNAV